MQVTLITAGILALLMVVLGLRVSAVRRSAGVSLGDGGNAQLEARIRAHGNCVETVPIALILLLLVEDRALLGQWLWLAAAVLVVARLLHPIGMVMPAPNFPRVFGMVGTWSVIGILALAVLWAGLTFERVID